MNHEKHHPLDAGHMHCDKCGARIEATESHTIFEPKHGDLCKNCNTKMQVDFMCGTDRVKPIENPLPCPCANCTINICCTKLHGKLKFCPLGTHGA